jgi:hypothetical protein
MAPLNQYLDVFCRTREIQDCPEAWGGNAPSGGAGGNQERPAIRLIAATGTVPATMFAAGAAKCAEHCPGIDKGDVAAGLAKVLGESPGSKDDAADDSGSCKDEKLQGALTCIVEKCGADEKVRDSGEDFQGLLVAASLRLCNCDCGVLGTLLQGGLVQGGPGTLFERDPQRALEAGCPFVDQFLACTRDVKTCRAIPGFPGWEDFFYGVKPYCLMYYKHGCELDGRQEGHVDTCGNAGIGECNKRAGAGETLDKACCDHIPPFLDCLTGNGPRCFEVLLGLLATDPNSAKAADAFHAACPDLIPDSATALKMMEAEPIVDPPDGASKAEPLRRAGTSGLLAPALIAAAGLALGQQQQ